MSPVTQEVENFHTQQHCPENVDNFCHGNEEERELEEALSLCDLPIHKIDIGNQEDNAKEEESQNAGHNLDNDFDFDFGSVVGSISTLDGEMCAADEVFSGGQILPYRNSVSSMSGLRSVSRSDSMDRRGFESRSSSSRSSRSSSIRSHYSATSSGSGSTSGGSSSNSTTVSAKTVPLVSKAKVRNQFHSYPSPKPQILGSGMRSATCTTPAGKRSKMWEVLKLGLVRTPEIELQDLKQRRRTNNHGKTITTIPRNNSIGSSTKAGIKINDDRPRNSSIDGNKISDFMSEVQKKKNQLSENQSNSNGNGNSNSGFFKSCKCSVGAIEPIQSTISNSCGVKSVYFGSGNNKVVRSQNISPANRAANEDKNIAQKKIQVVEEQKHQQQSGNNNHLRQGKQVMSHHHHRTFEWLKNLSHASVLNS